jgi:hypothetical protein
MKTCEIFGMMTAGGWMVLAPVALIALALTFYGDRILEYLKRRSNSQACESQISRHSESAMRARTASKISNP